ncbi:MAG: hypothetical protein AAF434_03350 [Pseudomonadota bacterium]
MTDFYQSEAWSRIVTRMRESRVPHALLVSGHRSSEKSAFARAIATSLLCQSPREGDARACGKCASCGLLDAGSHADFLSTGLLEDSRTIRIDQIRKLCEELALTAQHGGYRVAIINPADAMNVNASNSLLKSLEEPPSNTVMILVSSKTGSIPATIRSRCQRIRVDSARDDTISNEAIATLDEWCGAIQLREDAIAVTADWAKRDHEEVFGALFMWFRQRVRERCGATRQQTNQSQFIDSGNLEGEPATINTQQLFGFYDKLTAAYRQAAKPGISRRALYEQLLLEARARHLI